MPNRFDHQSSLGNLEFDQTNSVAIYWQRLKFENLKSIRIQLMKLSKYTKFTIYTITESNSRI